MTKTLATAAFICSLLLTATQALAQARPAVVELQTNLGTIAVRLDYAKAPITADNFVAYVTSGFYKDLLIHRVTKEVIFVVQGGGIRRTDLKLNPPTYPPILNEANNGLSNLTGTIAMARTSEPNSATSQFFINLDDNTNLDYGGPTGAGYAVFGKVIKGLAVARTIENLPTWGELPFSGSALVWIDAAHATAVWNTNVAITRITRSGSGTGTVSSVPAGISCGTSCSITQPRGEPLELKAVPAANSAFAGWRGDCTGMRRILDIDTTRGNHNCTAIFNRNGPALQ